MNTVDNRIKLEISIINAAEQHLATAIRHADPDNVENITIDVAQIWGVTVEEAREEQMMDALARVECLTSLTLRDSGLSKHGKKALMDIQIRAWDFLEPFAKPIPNNAVIMSLKPRTS